MSIRSRESRQPRKEGDILHNHGLHGGGLILLHLLREARESREDEQRGDYWIVVQSRYKDEPNLIRCRRRIKVV